MFEEVKIGHVRNPPEAPPLLYLCTLLLDSARLEAMREAECRRARDINDLILYISASFNHTMDLLREALNISTLSVYLVI